MTAFLQKYAKKGEIVPKVGPLLDYLARALTASTADMTKADDHHESEQADDVAPRLSRDEVVAATRETLLDLRAGLVPAGRAALSTFGLADAVPENAQAVLATGRFVLGALKDDKLAWPKARRGITVDRKVFIEDLAAHVPALSKALDKVATEAKELESAQLAKDDSTGHYDRVFSYAAGIGWEVFKLGGKIELADRIRPSARRPGQTERPPEEPTTPTPAPE